IISPVRTLSASVELPNGIIDSFQTPMRKCRVGSAPMGLLVRSKKIHMHHRQAARQIHSAADRDNFPERHTDQDSRENELEFLGQTLSLPNPLNHIPKSDEHLYD